MIGKLGIGDAGIAATANTASGLASRAFSPDGDGYKDTLRLSWVNGRDLDALELRLIDPDGTVAGVVPLSAGRLTAGAHTFAWDGHAGGSRLPNGLYLLALVGSASGTVYSNPSQTLIRAAQLDALRHPHRHDEPDAVDERQPERDLAQRRRLRPIRPS